MLPTKMNNRLSYPIILLLINFITTSCKESWDKIYTPAIASTWKVNPVETDETGNFISGPIEMVWKTSEEILLGGAENGMELSYATNFVTIKGSHILTSILKDVTIGEDYDISATYSDIIKANAPHITSPDWKSSGTGYAKYKEVTGQKKLLIFLDINKITGGDKEIESKINSFPVLKDLITKGIPVLYETTPDQKNIMFWVDVKLAKQLLPLVISVVTSIKDEDFGGNGSYIRFLLGNIEEVMNITTEFNLILKMSK